MKAIQVYGKICGWIEKVLSVFCATMLAGITLMTFLEAVLRYSFHASFNITQELVTFCMPWLAFVGGAIAWRRDSLVSIDVLGKAPNWLKILCAVVGHLLILWLLVVCIKSGVRYTVRNIAQTYPSMGISMAYPYASVPVGCLLMVLYSVEKILLLRRSNATAASES